MDAQPEKSATEAAPRPGLTLKASEDGCQVIAVIAAKAPNLTPVNNHQLKNLLQQEGYGEWSILDKAVIEACSLVGKTEQAREVVVAERLDGEARITVSADGLEAQLEIVPPKGGKPVTEADVLNALAAQGITYGIDKSAIDVTERKVITVARGIPPVDGEDSRFESLIPNVNDKRPKIREDGTADYFEIGAFVTVSEGALLMRRHTPTTGKNGVDVHGKVILAKAGKPLEFKSNMKGVKIDDKDRDLLLAANGGQPEIIERGMQVLPVINLENVDLSTGNIDFDGTVNVKSQVREGITIFATGDVVISGICEGADIKSDGSIMIQNGVIGRGKVGEEHESTRQGVARLKCSGSIDARFIENAVIEADKDITVADLISHSDVTARHYVKVGKKGGKKGHIRGGRIRATISVEAQVIGSPANIKTEIEVGSDPDLREKINTVTMKLVEAEGEYQKLSSLVARLRNQHDEKSKGLLVKALTSMKEIIAAIEALNKEKADLKKQDEMSDKSCVIVGKNTYPGVKISIGDYTYTVQRVTEAGRFVLKDNEIVFEPGH